MKIDDVLHERAEREAERGSLVPTVVERTGRGERAYDIFSRLLKDRIVFLGSVIDDIDANLIVAQMLFLQNENKNAEVSLYINSLGGAVTAWVFYIKRPELPGEIQARFKALYTLLLRKYYFDEFYDTVFAGGARRQREEDVGLVGHHELEEELGVGGSGAPVAEDGDLALARHRRLDHREARVGAVPGAVVGERVLVGGLAVVLVVELLGLAVGEGMLGGELVAYAVGLRPVLAHLVDHPCTVVELVVANDLRRLEEVAGALFGGHLAPRLESGEGGVQSLLRDVLRRLRDLSHHVVRIGGVDRSDLRIRRHGFPTDDEGVVAAELVANPRDAIVFDHAHQRIVDAREAAVGADGRRVHHGDRVLHLNLAEKLVIPVLAKLSALVPGAGIWMNTQRPEWNDANNALAGYGVSGGCL